MTLTEADDNRHEPLTDEPNFSESWVFNGFDPDNNLWVAMRLGLKANSDTASLAVFLAVDGKEAYNHIRENLPVPDGDMISGMSVDGFTVVAKKLLEEFHVTFKDEQFQFSFALDWSAVMPAHNAVKDPSSGNAAATFHLEQAGKVSGELAFLGKTYQFNGLGNRDHALGNRDWSKLLRHALAWPVFEDGTAMSIVRAYNSVSDKPFDLMWYYDGNSIRDLEFISATIELNEEDYPMSAEFVAEDDDGYRYELICKRRAVIHWANDGYLQLENAFEYRLQDGRVGYGLMELGKKLGMFSSEELANLA